MRTDGNGTGSSQAHMAPGALAWYKVDDLNAEQVAVMHSLDDARRAGLITKQDFHEIEMVIRRGHVHGARKRITEAKRRHAAR